MAERFLSARPPLQYMNDNILYHARFGPPLSPREQRSLLGSARSRPGREAAKRTLDGEDRSGIIQGEGKGGRL